MNLTLEQVQAWLAAIERLYSEMNKHEQSNGSEMLQHTANQVYRCRGALLNLQSELRFKGK